MSFNYPLAALASTLKVASSNRLIKVKVEFNGLNIRVLDILYKNGVIRGFKVIDKDLFVFLKYKHNSPAFQDIKLVSKPSRRVFWAMKALYLESSSFGFSGFFILSTSKGLISSHEALTVFNISGEVLLKVII